MALAAEADNRSLFMRGLTLLKAVQDAPSKIRKAS
jgi:hypothetical protein